MAKKIIRGSLRFPSLFARSGGLRAKRPQRRRARNGCFRRLCQGRRWAGSYLRSVAELQVASSVAGQHEDPIKAINSVVYPFPFRGTPDRL